MYCNLVFPNSVSKSLAFYFIRKYGQKPILEIYSLGRFYTHKKAICKCGNTTLQKLNFFLAKHVFHFNFANTKKEVGWRYLLKAFLTSKDCEWQLTLMYSEGSTMSRSKVWYESFLWIWQTQFCVIKNHYINSRPSTFHSEFMYSSFCWYKSMKYRSIIKLGATYFNT